MWPVSSSGKLASLYHLALALALASLYHHLAIWHLAIALEEAVPVSSSGKLTSRQLQLTKSVHLPRIFSLDNIMC